MKNKKLTYLLLAGVAVVWAIIFYRIYAAVVEDDIIATPLIEKKESFFNQVNHGDDSVSIDMTYSDPFSGKRIVRLDTVDYQAPKIREPLKPSKVGVKWAVIRYLGSVANSARRSRVAIVQLEGKEMMLKEGEEVNGLKLIKNAGDSIKVGYQNEVRYIKF